MLFSCQSKKEKTEVLDVAADNFTVSKNPKLDNVSLDFIMGKFDPSKDTTFVKIPTQFADREGMYMKKEAFSAFKIWEKKWTGKTILSNGEDASKTYLDPATRALKILEYSSMPGTSRHHWGTDIDFNNFNNSWFESGEGLKLFNWLSANASDFGFCRPYTEKGENRPDGYNEEKWHWSYTPLSDIYTEFAKTNLSSSMINNFQGSAVSDKIDVVNKYVLGINHSCKVH